jgi:hypothetical protein
MVVAHSQLVRQGLSKGSRVITTNAAWDAANAKMAKRPIYAFSIAGQSTVFTSADLVRAGITGDLPAYEAWLKVPQGASQSIDIVNGTSSIGELQVEVVDHGGLVRGIAGSDGVCGAIAMLRVGYPGIAWAEFVPLATYVAYKVNPSAGYTSWFFVCRDRQLLMKKTIYAHPENGLMLSADNPWYLCGTPAEIFQAICLFALGLDAADVDRAQMLKLDDPAEGLFAAARPFLFCITDSFEAKQFVETELLKPCCMYPVVSNTGQLSLRAARPPAAGPNAVFDFTQHNMVILPKVDRMPVINEAVWQFDAGESDFGSYETFIEATSISMFGRGNQFAVQSKGLRSELGAYWFIEWVTDRLFRRFAGTPTGLKGGAPTVDIEAMLMTLPVWAGDFVTVTHPKMPDVTSGTLGVDHRVYEVIERSPDYARGRVKYKLLDTGLTGQPAAYEFGAASARPFVIGTSPIY